MKISGFIIFLLVVIGLYSLVNYYIFIRGLQAIPAGSSLRLFYKITFITMASSFLIARVLERVWLSPFSNVMMWIGSFWFAAMIYFLLCILLFELIRLINWIHPIYPAFITLHFVKVKFLSLIGVVIFVSGLMIYGYFNAITPHLTKLDLNVNKNAGTLKELKILGFSDLHLSALIGKKEVREIVKYIDELKPDIVVIAGDLIDENPEPVEKYDLGAELKNIKTKYGVYGIFGNHEFIGGADKAEKYFNDHNIILLKDSCALIDNSFYLAGRLDKDMKRFNGKERKSLKEIVEHADRNLPLIVLDHQPFNLNESVEVGADLQVSGHTHRGQFFPVNLITDLIFEKSFGYLQKENTHIYVSSGYGTWGPKIRIGSSSDIFLITLHFK